MTEMNKASICLIEGGQGAGKTNTAVAKVVDAIQINPDTKVFTNFHLYGIKYVLADLPTIIEYLNSDLIKDGYVVIDESYIGGDARMGMVLLTKVLTWFGMQIRKRQLHLILIAQHGRMIDWRFRYFMTEHIICSCDDDTHMITLKIKRRGDKKAKTVRYYGPQYWKYFNTYEVPQIPESVLAKALVGAR